MSTDDHERALPPPRTERGPASRREQNKAEKLRRIKEASLAMFLTKGFDDATTRDIARVAGVALGTLFVYAENKRDLLFLIINDDLEATLQRAETALSSRRGLIANAGMVAEMHFVLFARRPDVSRIALREMYFYDKGMQSRRFHETRVQLQRIFTRVVELAAAQGEVITDDADTIGDILFSIYQIEVRRCLERPKVDPKLALQSFRKKVGVVAKGLLSDRAARRQSD